MGRWDNRKSENGMTGQIPVKMIILLIGIMALLWVIIVLSTVTTPINCIEINKIIDSSQFYELNYDKQILYKQLCRSNIIIR